MEKINHFFPKGFENAVYLLIEGIRFCFSHSFRILHCMGRKAETLQSGVIGRKSKIVFCNQIDMWGIWWWPCPGSEGLRLLLMELRVYQEYMGCPQWGLRSQPWWCLGSKVNGSIRWLLESATLTLGTAPLPFSSSFTHHIMALIIPLLNTCKTLMVFLPDSSSMWGPHSYIWRYRYQGER